MANSYPRDAAEHELLHSMIKANRDAVLWKLEGITDEQAKQRVVASDTTLLGIVRHLQYVDRWWVRIVIDGGDIPVPWSRDDPDADWRVTDDDTIDQVVADYQAELELVDAIIDGIEDLSATVTARDRTFALRWILMHLVEETARHAGHADIIREVIDGEVGYVR